MNRRRITLAHGGGGEAMRELVEQLFLHHFHDPLLTPLDDQARLPPSPPGSRPAFTTDAYVVQPLFFPGGDIGRLAVAGTVNDLVVGGAEPAYLSCAFIIEEGLPLETLERIVASMAATASEAGIRIVTGDTKVVPRGAADGLFITTSGIGHLPEGRQLSPRAIQAGDAILVSGWVGDHGAAITAAREELALEGLSPSDCRPSPPWWRPCSPPAPRPVACATPPEAAWRR